MRRLVINANRRFNRPHQLRRRRVNHEAKLLLDAPVKPFDLAAALGVIRCAKDVPDPVLRQISRKNIGGEPGAIVCVKRGHLFQDVPFLLRFLNGDLNDVRDRKARFVRLEIKPKNFP